jgi:hypothetical protein
MTSRHSSLPPHVVEFGGPEAISRNDAIAIAERITGRRMKRQQMPAGIALLGMRLLDKRNPALASVFGAGVMQDRVEATWDDKPLRERGIVATSASAYLANREAL